MSTLKVDSQEFVNAYIERQQRAISDLMNKVVMLETQLQLAQRMINELNKPKHDPVEANPEGFSSAEVKTE
jgi:hypothetical protein